MNIVKAEKREPTAKAKQLRRMGIVPCVIDGAELKESLIIQIGQGDAKQLKRSKRNGSKIDVSLEGKTYHTLIKELEYNSVNNEIVHIGFHILDADKKVNSVADIILLNKEKTAGILELMQLQVPHAAKPQYLLDTVSIDVAEIPVGTALTIGDIPEFKSENIELQADSDNIVLRIRDKKRLSANDDANQEEAAE